MVLTELSGALHPHIESRDNIKIDLFTIFFFLPFYVSKF